MTIHVLILGRDSLVPNTVAERTLKVQPVNHGLVPSVDDAVEIYENAGGRITRECVFGFDPLAYDENLTCQRDREFLQNNYSFLEIYNNAASGDGSLLKSGLRSFINSTVNQSLAHA